MTAIKPFARQGNFTAVDNAIFDHIMPKLNGSEWMVLCLIIRKTIGWHKDADGISYSQFIEHTGIKSNTTIQKALNGLIDKRLIELGKSSDPTAPHHYRLNKKYTIGITETVTQPITFSVTQPLTETVNTKEKINKNKKGSGGENAYWQIPEVLKTEGFVKAWKFWLDSIDERDIPFTETQARLVLAELAEMGPDRATTATSESTKRGWRSIYEPRHSNNVTAPQTVTHDIDGGMYV